MSVRPFSLHNRGTCFISTQILKLSNTRVCPSLICLLFLLHHRLSRATWPHAHLLLPWKHKPKRPSLKQFIKIPTFHRFPPELFCQVWISLECICRYQAKPSLAAAVGWSRLAPWNYYWCCCLRSAINHPYTGSDGRHNILKNIMSLTKTLGHEVKVIMSCAVWNGLPRGIYASLVSVILSLGHCYVQFYMTFLYKNEVNL